MNYDATVLLGNTFFTLRLTNHYDCREVVERDVDKLARALGASFMYLETVEEKPE